MSQNFFNSNTSSADEIRSYIQKANEGMEETETDLEEERLDKIADEDIHSHNNIVSVIVLAFVMIFFGTVFVALTNYQDFSEGEGFTWKRFASGSFFSEVERNFNKSLPLRDYLQNAETAIKYCYGTGNEADYIDIESKRLADDPYNIEEVNEYIPITETDDDYVPIFDNGDGDDEQVTSLVTTDNNKNKKLSGIRITTVSYAQAGDSSASKRTTKLNFDAPEVTYTTTEPSTETTTLTTTETTVTESETETESETRTTTHSAQIITTTETTTAEETTTQTTTTQTQPQTSFVIPVPAQSSSEEPSDTFDNGEAAEPAE